MIPVQYRQHKCWIEYLLVATNIIVKEPNETHCAIIFYDVGEQDCYILESSDAIYIRDPRSIGELATAETIPLRPELSYYERHYQE